MIEILNDPLALILDIFRGSIPDVPPYPLEAVRKGDLVLGQLGTESRRFYDWMKWLEQFAAEDEPGRDYSVASPRTECQRYWDNLSPTVRKSLTLKLFCEICWQGFYNDVPQIVNQLGVVAIAGDYEMVVRTPNDVLVPSAYDPQHFTSRFYARLKKAFLDRTECRENAGFDSTLEGLSVGTVRNMVLRRSVILRNKIVREKEKEFPDDQEEMVDIKFLHEPFMEYLRYIRPRDRAENQIELLDRVADIGLACETVDLLKPGTEEYDEFPGCTVIDNNWNILLAKDDE